MINASKIVSDIGLVQEMYPYMNMIPEISRGTGELDRAVYDINNIIEPKQAFGNLDWAPAKSEASAPTNGGVHRVTKTGLGSITGNMTGFDIPTQLKLFTGIYEEAEAYYYDFTRFTSNPVQLNFANIYTSGKVRCFKVMRAKFDLPGEKAQAQDPNSAVANVDNAFTVVMESTTFKRDIYFKEFNLNDENDIMEFMTNPYPADSETVAFTIESVTEEGTLDTATTTIEVSFSEDVSSASIASVVVYSGNSALAKSAYTVTIDSEDAETIEIAPVSVAGWPVGQLYIGIPKSFAAKSGKPLGVDKIYEYNVADLQG